MKKKRKNKQMDQRTKIVFFFVLVFVIAMSVSYLGLYRQSRELKKEEKQVEADIRDAKKRKN